MENKNWGYQSKKSIMLMMNQVTDLGGRSGLFTHPLI